MLACTALVGCTSDDEPVVNNGNQVNGENADAYMSVKLIMTEASGSRAAKDGGYDKGTTTEQAINVNNSIFLFYDEDGDYIASGDLHTTDMTDHTSSTHTGDSYGENYVDINDIHGKAFIAISAPDDGIKAIKQVLTVVNYKGEKGVAELDKLDLEQVKAKIVNATNDPANEGFLMTTSVFADPSGTNTDDVIPTGATTGDGLIYTTAVKDGNIKSTQQEALTDGNYVEIYIERASAKVEVLWNGAAISESNHTLAITPDSENATDTDTAVDEEKEADILVDGNLTEASIKILGWTVNNINETSNLVKDIDANWWAENSTTIPFTGWSNVTDHRSYWAKGTKYNISTGENNLTAFTFNNALPNNGTEDDKTDDKVNSDPMYCYEHTVGTPNFTGDRTTSIDNPNITTVLIAAQVKFNVDENEYERELFKYNGVYYTETGYKNIILQKLADAGYTKAGKKKAIVETENEDGTTTTTETEVDATDLPLTPEDILINEKTNALADVTVTIKKENTYYLKETQVTDNSTIDTAIAALDYVDSAKLDAYKDGYCYYQIPIEHLSSTGGEEDGEYFYGVVRNHWYRLDITKVKHIGEAVYNPTIEIPTIPAKKIAHYLAARIHVLSWHVVKQEVTLD